MNILKHKLQNWCNNEIISDKKLLLLAFTYDNKNRKHYFILNIVCRKEDISSDTKNTFKDVKDDKHNSKPDINHDDTDKK